MDPLEAARTPQQVALELTGSLVAPVITHAIYNAVVFAMQL